MLKVEVRHPAQPELQELHSAWMSTWYSSASVLRQMEAETQDFPLALAEHSTLGAVLYKP